MKKHILYFLCLCFLTTIPAYSLSKANKLIVDEIQKLGLIIKEVEQRMAAMERKLQIIDDRMAALSRSQADSNQNRENLSLSLQFIKEELIELKNNVTQINDRMVTLSQKDLSENSAEPELEAGQDSPLQSPENIYYTAYSDYLKKSYELAIKGFQQFIKFYPDNGLSDNSMYWIGECYYSQKNFQEAANTFNRLIAEYGEGDKIPAAMLKKGFALMEMGRQVDGTDALKDLISKFPLSEEASLAQQKIREVLE